MTPRWRVSASPATADRKASTLVLTGGAVSYIVQRELLYLARCWVPERGLRNEKLDILPLEPDKAARSDSLQP